MREIGYDAAKMPLGQLSESNIKKGFECLQLISECLEEQIDTKKNHLRKRLSDLSSQFYTFIPHDFGMARMSQFILDCDEDVVEKHEMLKQLADITLATKILNEVQEAPDEHPVDAKYRQLKVTIAPLAAGSAEVEMVRRYTQLTHGMTHNQYKLEVECVYKVEREGEQQRYERFIKEHNIGNKQLLWHGSRVTNWAGILSTGLRIAPPEAPVTGYMVSGTRANAPSIPFD